MKWCRKGVDTFFVQSSGCGPVALLLVQLQVLDICGPVASLLDVIVVIV
jgi:hypothetical protein